MVHSGRGTLLKHSLAWRMMMMMIMMLVIMVEIVLWVEGLSLHPVVVFTVGDISTPTVNSSGCSHSAIRRSYRFNLRCHHWVSMNCFFRKVSGFVMILSQQISYFLQELSKTISRFAILKINSLH
jgi:hypothetical protein